MFFFRRSVIPKGSKGIHRFESYHEKHVLPGDSVLDRFIFRVAQLGEIVVNGGHASFQWNRLAFLVHFQNQFSKILIIN